MKALGIFTAFVITAFLSAIWSGFVICKLWVWFAVPLGAPTVSLAHMIGLRFLWSSFVGYRHQHDERDTKTKLSEAVGFAIFFPALALLSGWVVTLFLS